MPIQIGEVTVATANGKIYAIGGSTADIVDQRLNQEYDIATDRWRERAPLPRGMTHAAATSLNGKIYVVGAFTASGHGNAVNLVTNMIRQPTRGVLSRRSKVRAVRSA